MRVKSLILRDFRSYESAEIHPAAGITVFAGRNAQGKTNLLEAIHLCCTGRSHRTSRDEEMIRWGCSGAKATVAAEQRDGTHEVSVVLLRGQKKKKHVLIGARQAERIGELFGHVCCVLFSPEDLSIVKGGPSERRRFLDMQLSQLRPGYFYALQRSAHALLQRNALLREIESHPGLIDTLNMWDEQLALAGDAVVRGRREVTEALSRLAGDEHERLTDGAETLSLRLSSEAAKEENPGEYLLRRLSETREEDLRRGTTTTGVHRDDLLISVSGKDARVYASQGQQRTAVLSLKLAQTAFAEAERGEPPVLMLDDVMSELDPVRRCLLISRIDRLQTFVTCTDPADLSGAPEGMIFRVENRKILPE